MKYFFLFLFFPSLCYSQSGNVNSLFKDVLAKGKEKSSTEYFNLTRTIDREMSALTEKDTEYQNLSAILKVAKCYVENKNADLNICEANFLFGKGGFFVVASAKQLNQNGENIPAYLLQGKVFGRYFGAILNKNFYDFAKASFKISGGTKQSNYSSSGSTQGFGEGIYILIIHDVKPVLNVSVGYPMGKIAEVGDVDDSSFEIQRKLSNRKCEW